MFMQVDGWTMLAHQFVLEVEVAEVEGDLEMVPQILMDLVTGVYGQLPC